MKVLCHRGIDFDQDYTESSKSSFEQALKACDGLEFDLQLSKDDQLFVWHDQDASRLTSNQLSGPLSQYTISEIRDAATAVSPICLWSDISHLITMSPDKLFSIHLKGANQSDHFLKYLCDALEEISDQFPSLLIFDLRLETAKILNTQFPNLPLALSVSDTYDIQRFNSVTNNTLYSIEDCCESASFLQWAWLDEWDLRAADGGKKEFYSSSTVNRLKATGLKVAVVSPELHATSPSLLGGEAHEEGANLELLKMRWKKLKQLNIDAICTDYPSLLKRQWLAE